MAEYAGVEGSFLPAFRRDDAAPCEPMGRLNLDEPPVRKRTSARKLRLRRGGVLIIAAIANAATRRNRG
jgi:hypothetical protein